MSLVFLNPSRSYDETRKAIRFIGHDGMSEIRFFVEVGALDRSGAEMCGTRTSEAACLTAFDGSVDAIRKAAHKLYQRGRQPTYTLTSNDFR